MNDADSPRSQNSNVILYAILIFCVISLAVLFFPLSRGHVVLPTVQVARTLDIALFQYANDHADKYPTGANSTEVFQKLVDENYISDPHLFYIPMPGKVESVRGAKLKPENVCWDITSGLDNKSDDNVPVVFMTGYRVSYTAGSDAVPLIKPFPVWGTKFEPRNLWETLFQPDQYRWEKGGGVPVCYHSNSARWIISDPAKGVVPNFVSPSFHSDGHTYVQLTPDGHL